MGHDMSDTACSKCGADTGGHFKYGIMAEGWGRDFEFRMPEPSARAGRGYTTDLTPEWEAHVAAGGDPKGRAEFRICVPCLDRMVDEGRAAECESHECLSCGKRHWRVHCLDGSFVDERGHAVMGYGSTTADGDVRSFSLPPGFHCYDCLDALVRDGKSSLVEAWFFLGRIREEQKPGDPELLKQMLRAAMENYNEVLKVCNLSGRDAEYAVKFVRRRLSHAIETVERALGEEFKPAFGPRADRKEEEGEPAPTPEDPK